jgi:hypothetical protein
VVGVAMTAVAFVAGSVLGFSLAFVLVSMMLKG